MGKLTYEDGLSSHFCYDETIDNIKEIAIVLMSTTGNCERFELIEMLSKHLSDLKNEFSTLEQESIRNARMAKEMRLQLGKELNDLCDLAGIE